MQQNEIHVVIKDQYGCITYVPHNEMARAMAEIAGTKTLTPRVLKVAQGMGYKIKGVPVFMTHNTIASNSNYMPIELAF